MLALGNVFPKVALVTRLLINFFGHYLFASVTAHVNAMIPVLLAVASTIPGIKMHTPALGLCLQLGIMSILTSYTTGPSPVYYGSGYLPATHYWRLGAILGVIFLTTFLVIGVPWMLRSEEKSTKFAAPFALSYMDRQVVLRGTLT